jgi:hypothetical protein
METPGRGRNERGLIESRFDGCGKPDRPAMQLRVEPKSKIDAGTDSATASAIQSPVWPREHS